MRFFTKCVLTVLFVVNLSGCSFFNLSKDNSSKPASLTQFRPTQQVNEIWQTSTRAGAGKSGLGFGLAMANGRLFTDGDSGKVVAVSAKTGQILWQKQLKTKLTSGPEVGGNLVLLGTEDAQIIALRQTDGQKVWQASVPNQTLAAPHITGNIVLVKSLGGELTALNLTNGKDLWHFKNPPPSIVLRQASRPNSYKNYAIAGFEDGKLTIFKLNNGQPLWQRILSLPSGSTPMAQLVDIDADPVVKDGLVYVVSYHGHVTVLDIASGREVWRRPLSSYTGLTVDNDHVYVADDESYIWALQRYDGSVAWRQTKLHARKLTAPVVMDNTILVGDAEGYLHWLNKNNGRFVAREKLSSYGIKAQPIVNNNMVYVIDQAGNLAAYRLLS